MEHHLIYMLMIDFANHFCIFFQKNFNIFPFFRQIGDFCRFSTDTETGRRHIRPAQKVPQFFTATARNRG